MVGGLGWGVRQWEGWGRHGVGSFGWGGVGEVGFEGGRLKYLESALFSG